MNEKEQIIEALKADYRRDIYETRNPREFYISYRGGGPFHPRVVYRLVVEKVLERKYQGCEVFKLSDSLT